MNASLYMYTRLIPHFEGQNFFHLEACTLAIFSIDGRINWIPYGRICSHSWKIKELGGDTDILQETEL